MALDPFEQQQFGTAGIEGLKSVLRVAQNHATTVGLRISSNRNQVSQ